MLYNNNGLNIYDTLLELFNKVAEIDTKKIEPLLKDITNNEIQMLIHNRGNPCVLDYIHKLFKYRFEFFKN